MGIFGELNGFLKYPWNDLEFCFLLQFKPSWVINWGKTQVVSHYFWRELLTSSSWHSKPVSNISVQAISPGKHLAFSPTLGGSSCLPRGSPVHSSDCPPSHPGYLVDPASIFLQGLSVVPMASEDGNKSQRVANSSWEQLRSSNPSELEGI